MPRRTTVTVTAAAVTLACLGASFYASPPVVAETMGREIQVFSPLNPASYPVEPSTFDAGTQTPQTQTREQSVLADVAPSDPRAMPPVKAHPRQVEEVTLKSVAADEAEAGPQRPAAAPSKKPRESSSIEVTLPKPEPTSPVTSDDAASKLLEDVDSPDSMTVIVNKQRPLPADYEPDDLVELTTESRSGPHLLRQEAANAAHDMFDAAQQDGINLTVLSAYRSYEYQTSLYDDYVRQYGAAATDKMSARPGYSEHQTGLALDVDTPGGEHTLKQSFGETVAGQWLAEHAHEFGFVVRYPKDAQKDTGFHYEPWHLRYFGEQHAHDIVERSGVAEREFALDPAPDYQE